MNTENIDHLLEQLWMAAEDQSPVETASTTGSGEVQSNTHVDEATKSQYPINLSAESIELLKAGGYVVQKNGAVELTKAGLQRAEGLIRRHRLAEMLLTEIFDLDLDPDQSEICKIEHVMSPRIVDRMCSFLGHPPVCPHGRTIPRGKCCKRNERDIPPLVEPLSEARVGEEYKIVFIFPRHHTRLDRLAVLGIGPGAIIHLHQRQPSYVLKIAETEVAVDKDIARDIYVRPV